MNTKGLASRQKGFTLIELLIIIAVIGILTAVLLYIRQTPTIWEK